MRQVLRALVCSAVLFAGADAVFAIERMPAEKAAAAAADYQKYCALCHGADRQGYANDYAPSLRSKTLIASGFPHILIQTIGYGRLGTPMAAFFEEMGGPLTRQQLNNLVTWLREQADVEPVDLPLDPVPGDVELGRRIFGDECAVCHGDNGEGEIGPAIGNPAMLANVTDAFLRYTIVNGRDETDMPAFGEIFSAAEIDAVTAFLRSRSTGWSLQHPVLQEPPTTDQYVLNPRGEAPQFVLQDGLYVKSADLLESLQEGRRLILLDTRVTSMWQTAHIAGAVPIPYYYEEFAALAADLPDDGTWIVSYCECPRAAAEHVTEKLREKGLANTAVLWEGFQGWVSLGFPVALGQTRSAETR